MSDETLLTIAEVAELLAVSVRHVHAMRRRRPLACYRIGGATRFRREDVMAWREQFRVEAVEAVKPPPRSAAARTPRQASEARPAQGGKRWDWIEELA